jgi:periplasmic divalent cation tolerance protein
MLLSTQAVLVLTTCENTERARALADRLVGERLAACVNVVPQISSTYLWKGKIQTDEEVLLLIKTTQASFDAVEKAVKTLSTYELPEVVAVPIHAGSAEYLAWLGASLAD